MEHPSPSTDNSLISQNGMEPLSPSSPTESNRTPNRSRKSSSRWVLIALCLVVVSAAAGTGFYRWSQARAEEARLTSLRDQIKSIVREDNALSLEVLEIDKSSNITFGEFFKRTEKNKEERDDLIRRLRSIEADTFTSDSQKFIRLMEFENEFVRAQEALARQQMETSSRFEILEASVNSFQKAATAAASKYRDYLEAPYGYDSGERFDYRIAESRLGNDRELYDSALGEYKKASDTLKSKRAAALTAADDWISAEGQHYPAFAPARDVKRLLIKWKAKQQGSSELGSQASTVASSGKDGTPKNAPGAETGLKQASLTSPTPIATVSTGTKSTAGREPTRPTGPMPGERFPATRSGQLSETDVSALSEDDLRYAINEMYARYGMTFKNKSVQAKFEAFSWYNPNSAWSPSKIEASFTKAERKNLQLLTQERSLRHQPY